MKTTITRRFQFCAGHRVFQHESKCAHPHGHNYVLLATFEGDNGRLDTLGRVIDFSVVKKVLGDWIELHWDHGFIHYAHDREMLDLFIKNMHWKHFVLPYNPTAENMAAFLLNEVCPGLFHSYGITAVKMVLWETENCCAEVSCSQ